MTHIYGRTVKIFHFVGDFFSLIANVRVFRDELISRIKNFCILKYWDYQFSRGIYFREFGLLTKLNTAQK